MEKDIWRHLNEFFLVEVKGKTDLDPRKISGHPVMKEWSVSSHHVFPDVTRQMLTHQEIFAAFAFIELKKKPELPQGGNWLPELELKKIAFPKTINLFLESNQIWQGFSFALQ
jgi:hypothetical protein